MTTDPAVARRYAWGPARHRWSWLAWGVWLAFLAYPLADLRQRHFGAPAVVAAGAGLFAFAALFLRLSWLVWSAAADERRCRPTVIALAALGAGLGLGLRGGFIALFIYMSVAGAMAVRLRWVPVALGLTVGGSLVAQLTSADRGSPLAIAMQVCLNVFIGLLVVAYRRALALVAELHQARAELAHLAVTEERLRFARDLHDLLGHTLSAISLQSQVARRLLPIDRDEATRQLAQIETAAQQALTEVREAVTGYRHQSLGDELEAARCLLTEAGIRVIIGEAGDPPPPGCAAVLGWVVREAATNIVKHARAHSCRITVLSDTHSVTLDVADDGRGPTGHPAVQGHGLIGMAERIAAAGGQLATGPAAGGGFQLRVRLPVDGPAAVPLGPEERIPALGLTPEGIPAESVPR